MRGMFCSLLHQLACQNEYVQHLIMSRIPNWSNKDDYSDWRQQDLASLLDKTLASIPTPVFLVIDGLDEILTNETLDLVSAVNRFRGLRNVKVCVSSRPEPLFQAAFNAEKQLRLQDLTRGDMHKFASSIITEDWSTARGYDKEGVDELKGLLARNAEGVFLWLGLAGESLKRGYHKGDALEDLRNRLQSLPPELKDLYTEMWRRSNEDTQSNRESGSFYIKLLLDRYPSQMNLMNSLAFVMTTTNHELQRKYLGHLDQDVNWDWFASLCKETQRLVENRCAGLFQITASFEFRLGPTAPFDWPPSELRLHPEISALFDILPLNVSIVHRSAYDFLTESEEGSRIRSFDPSSPADRKSQLLRGYLTLATVLGGYIFFEFSDALSYLVACEEISEDLLRTCALLLQQLVTANHLRDSPGLRDLTLRRHVITHLLEKATGKRQSKSALFRKLLRHGKPKRRASRILRECLIRKWNSPRFDIAYELLNIADDQDFDVWAKGVTGGDPRHFMPLSRIDIWPAHKYLDTIPYLSAGALILFCELKHSIEKKVNTPEEGNSMLLTQERLSLSEYPHIYNKLAWADCNEFIPLTIRYWPNYPWHRGGDFCFAIHPFVREGVDLPAGDSRATYKCIFITLKCNLAFLAKALLNSESSTEFTNSFGGNAFSALPFASLMLITYTWRHKSSASCISSILPANERVSAEIMSQIWPCFQHTDEGIKLEKTLDMVREYFSGGNNHFKLLEEPVGHYLAREDCGYRFVKDIDPEELELELTISGFGPDYVFGSEVDPDQEEVDSDQEEEVED